MTQLSEQLLSATYAQLCSEKSDLNYQIQKLDLQRSKLLERIADIDLTVDGLNEATPIIKSIESQLISKYESNIKCNTKKAEN